MISECLCPSRVTSLTFVSSKLTHSDVTWKCESWNLTLNTDTQTNTWGLTWEGALRASLWCRWNTVCHHSYFEEGGMFLSHLPSLSCLHAYSSSFTLLFLFHHFLSTDPYPTDTNPARLVMKEMEVDVVEVMRVFIIQTVKSFGGPIEVWSWNGDATESACTP